MSFGDYGTDVNNRPGQHLNLSLSSQVGAPKPDGAAEALKTAAAEGCLLATYLHMNSSQWQQMQLLNIHQVFKSRRNC